MSDATGIYGWSGTGPDGSIVFVRGPVPAETALTAVQTYADQAAFQAARRAANAARIPFGNHQANAARAISTACAAAITGGFTSSALGAAHLYGSKATDQANLDTDMMAAATGPTVTADIVCSADGGKTWAAATHTAAQIGVLWGDFRAFRIAQQVKHRALRAAIAAATTSAALAAITWA